MIAKELTYAVTYQMNVTNVWNSDSLIVCDIT